MFFIIVSTCDEYYLHIANFVQFRCGDNLIDVFACFVSGA